MNPARAVVVGIEGERLSENERRLFCEFPPAGFILFQRNCVSRPQLRALVAELKELFEDRWVPVLIDHEGGRVQRMRPPVWRNHPPAGRIGALDAGQRETAVRLWASLLAADLADVGIDVDCAPVLDIRRPETTGAIGDRALSDDPQTVASLGRAFIATMLDHGVAPVIKHLPGHGRARVDSHELLPRLAVPADELATFDFLPFVQCADRAPFAMTAHIVFEALDADRPATESAAVIREIIRERIGFRGILFSDDLGMKALSGPVDERAMRALAAGVDLPLHCSGDFGEMRAILTSVPVMPEPRFALLQDLRPVAVPSAPDGERLTAQLDRLLASHA
ncbi:MAG: beta-N-acetylhexosaminidase [Geminicoccaceae bacterium]|nr:beta-N-acetylhexosaminidase [Geminicoccaceae bacterium]